MGSCHIAHDCKIGNNIIFANNTLLAGHVVVEVSPYALFGLWDFNFQDSGWCFVERYFLSLQEIYLRCPLYFFKSTMLHSIFAQIPSLCISNVIYIRLSYLLYLIYSRVSNVGLCSHCRGCSCSPVLPCWFFLFYWWWLRGMTWSYSLPSVIIHYNFNSLCIKGTCTISLVHLWV